MAVKRWLRLLRSRWWILGLAVVVGTAGGVAFARGRNQTITPLFEARATVAFDAVDPERGKEELQAELEAAAAIAKQANATVIAGGRGIVTVDQKTAELILSSRSSEGAEAKELAATMKMAYLEAAAHKAVAAAQDRIAEIILEAGDILARLNALAPPETDPIPAVDPEFSAQVDFLDSQVNALTQRSANLAVDRILAELGDDRVGSPEEIDEELVLIQDRLDDLYIEIAELTLSGEVSSRTSRGVETETSAAGSRGSSQTFEPVGAGLLESTWSIEALQTRFEDLQTEYQDLYIAAQPANSTEEQLPVQVENLTPDPSAIPLTAGLGAGAAALLAAAAIAVDDRIRRPLYVLPDFSPLPARAEVPSLVGVVKRSGDRRLRLFSGRTGGVRELRNSAFEWDEPSLGTPLIGLSGARVEHPEVQALALDLAGSLAAADRSVLIVNLDFTADPTDVTELGATAAPTVADLLEILRRDPEAGSLEIKKALADSIVLATRVRMLLAGTLGNGSRDKRHIRHDPTDVFLTTAFKTLLDRTREQADVVLAVIPPLNDPATSVVRQRLDGVIAVCRVGRTRRVDLGLAGKRGDTGNLVGAVLLTRWRRRIPLRRRVSMSLASAWSPLRRGISRLVGRRRTSQNDSTAEPSKPSDPSRELTEPVLAMDQMEATGPSKLEVESTLEPERSEMATRRRDRRRP